MSNYFIKSGYRCRRRPARYRDTVEGALTYQVDVYRAAADYIASLGLAFVLDVGCGYAVKLKKYVLPTGVAITGVDGRTAIKFCSTTHDFGRWVVDDVERPRADLGTTFDLIICSDIIEHLVNPDALLSYCRRWSHAGTRVLISTPERDLRRGPDHMGPPGNPAHVREWNSAEFRQYLQSHSLVIEDYRIVEVKPGMRTCQVALCSWTWSWRPDRR